MKSLLRNAYHYFLRTTVAGPPIKAYFLVHEGCNLKCQFCHYHQGIHRQAGKTRLSTEEIKRVINDMSNEGVRSLQITGGEPTLRPDILEIINHASTRIRFCNLTTNGTMITPELAEGMVTAGLDILWVSIDAVGEIHDKIRGVKGTFKKIVHGLELVNEAKKRRNSIFPTLYISSILSRDTASEVEKLARLAVKYKARELEVGCLFEQVPGSDSDQKQCLEKTATLLGTPDFYSGQYLQDEKIGPLFTEELEKRMAEARTLCRLNNIMFWFNRSTRYDCARSRRRRCLMIWNRLFIGPYGDLYPCELLDGYSVGNVLEDGIEKVWNGRKYRQLRHLFRKGLPICRLCQNARTSVTDIFKYYSLFERYFLSRKVRSAYIK